MSSQPRTLLSLPEDVLREILTHLLVDTARSSTRAAILLTCSTLHTFGLPLLHRIIDLRGFNTVTEMISAWRTLFGEKGTLTDQGRIPDLNCSVVELRIGSRELLPAEKQLVKAERSFQPTVLPRCTTLFFDRTHTGRAFGDAHFNLLAGLSISHLSFAYPDSIDLHPGVTDAFGSSFPRLALGLAMQPAAWSGLQTIRFCNSLWYEDAFDPGSNDGLAMILEPFTDRIACSAWTFETLIVEVAEQSDPASVDQDTMSAAEEAYRLQAVEAVKKFAALFLDPVETAESDGWWRGLQRIELRLPTWLEAQLQRKTDEAGRAGPFARLQRRILPMVVFVDEDGTERRLIEDESNA